MKIAHVGLHDQIGHKINGMDLCREMRARGIYARFYVFIKKNAKDPGW